jgi:hypothetical protein
MARFFLYFNLFTVLFLADAASATDRNRSVCASFAMASFYDFEQLDRDREIENWRTGNNEDAYHYRSPNHFGAMLIDNNGDLAFPLGFGKIDVIKNGTLTRRYFCPGCSSEHFPASCAFSNCYYKIRGKKKGGAIVILPWEKIEDRIVLFKNSKRLAEWEALIIECRRLSDPPPPEVDDF